MRDLSVGIVASDDDEKPLSYDGSNERHHQEKLPSPSSRCCVCRTKGARLVIPAFALFLQSDKTGGIATIVQRLGSVLVSLTDLLAGWWRFSLISHPAFAFG